MRIPNLSSKVPLLVLALVIIVLLLGGGAWYYIRHTQTRTVVYPEYLSFSGQYVFTVPKTYIVDERSLPGMQMLYPGKLNVKTLDEAYNVNAITLQPINTSDNHQDHSSGAFKKYVNETFLPNIKSNLSGDVKLSFGSFDGWDTARAAITKDGKSLRYVYLKNGQHPVAIVSKDETVAFKQIERTITDVETSDLKDDVGPLTQAIRQDAQFIRDQKASDLYAQTAPALKSKLSVADLTGALQAAAPYMKGPVDIDGGGYNINPSEFTVVLNFEQPDKNAAPQTGVIYLDKISGQWQVKAMRLPSPAQNQSDQQPGVTTTKS